MYYVFSYFFRNFYLITIVLLCIIPTLKKEIILYYIISLSLSRPSWEAVTLFRLNLYIDILPSGLFCTREMENDDDTNIGEDEKIVLRII